MQSTRPARSRACCSCSSCPTAPSRCWSRAPTRASAQVHRPQRLLRGRRRPCSPTTIGERVEAEAMARSVITEFENYVKLNKKVSPEVVGVIQQIEDYAKLADTVASHLAVKIPDKQAILETPSVTAAPGEGARPDGERDLRPAGREAHPHPRQAADGEDAARVLPQRADEGDPEGARRRRRSRRASGARRQDQEDQALEGGSRESDA